MIMLSLCVRRPRLLFLRGGIVAVCPRLRSVEGAYLSICMRLCGVSCYASCYSDLGDLQIVQKCGPPSAARIAGDGGVTVISVT